MKNFNRFGHWLLIFFPIFLIYLPNMSNSTALENKIMFWFFAIIAWFISMIILGSEFEFLKFHRLSDWTMIYCFMIPMVGFLSIIWLPLMAFYGLCWWMPCKIIDEFSEWLCRENLQRPLKIRLDENPYSSPAEF